MGDTSATCCEEVATEVHFPPNLSFSPVSG